MLIEGWTPLEAFYMTAISLTTVGFGEVRPLSDSGRLFTVALILIGVGSVAYGFTNVSEYLLTAGVGVRLWRQRMLREISKLDNHIIVVGYGRVGQNAAQTLKESGRQFVIVENDPELAQSIREAGLTVVEGDATKDEIVKEAGIERAWGIVVCTGSDPDNLFIVLSARTLNPELRIVARSSDAANDVKMRRAGADRVVSPHHIGGRHMVNLMIRPTVSEFMDVVTLDSGLELWLEELTISPNSSLAGKTVVETDMRRRTGVTLVALMRRETGMTLTPDADTRLQAGDELILLGTREQLAAVEKLTNSNGE